MYIIAHRGIWNNCLDNSKKAILTALTGGFSIEIDLRDTLDLELVLSHDEIINSKTCLSKNVHKSNYHELEEIFEKNGCDLLRIKDVFNFIDENGINKENQIIAIHYKCKYDHSLKLLIETIDSFDKTHKNLNIFEKLILFDVTLKTAKKIKKYTTKLDVAFSIGEESIFPNIKYPTIYTKKQIVKNTDYSSIWADEWKSGLYTKDFIDFFHKLNKKVYAISPELHKDTDPAHDISTNIFQIKKMWATLIEWGIDGICTDYCRELNEVLKDG